MKFPAKKMFMIAFVAATLASCGRGHKRVLEINYVSAPQVALRDQLSQVYNKTGTVKNGDRLEVLDHEKRFAKVRTASGVEGWVEQRYLVTQPIYDAFQKLAQQAKDVPVEGIAATRNDVNLHVEAGRDSEHLYLLPQGSKVSVLKRATAEKTQTGMAVKTIAKGVQPPREDWWLVRDPQGHAGWVLGRMIDLDVPIEVAQYAEGQRIVAYFELNQVTDGDKKVSQYLVVMTEPRDGLPFDYDQIRVFTWNVRRHRYETAYRERKLRGMLPVTVSHENFGKEGDLPVFVLRVADPNGNSLERKYKMNTPIVKRVE